MSNYFDVHSVLAEETVRSLKYQQSPLPPLWMGVKVAPTLSGHIAMHRVLRQVLNHNSEPRMKPACG